MKNTQPVFIALDMWNIVVNMKNMCLFSAISGQGTLKIYVEGKPWQIKSNEMNMYCFIAIRETQIGTHKTQITERCFFQASVGGGSVRKEVPSTLLVYAEQFT